MFKLLNLRWMIKHKRRANYLLNNEKKIKKMLHHWIKVTSQRAKESKTTTTKKKMNEGFFFQFRVWFFCCKTFYWNWFPFYIQSSVAISVLNIYKVSEVEKGSKKKKTHFNESIFVQYYYLIYITLCTNIGSIWVYGS